MVTGVAIKRLDHVGIIVDDLARASDLMAMSLGLKLSRETQRAELRAAFYSCGGVDIELIEVLEPAARAMRLKDQEAVIEHLAFEVYDLDLVLNVLEDLGIRANAPPRTSGPTRTFWTDPGTSDGIMLQFLVPLPLSNRCTR